ncbi:MAG: S24 family peptidase [Syntrophobacteraceae bacterium]|nr:S24 family peptidase [Syntrophobacteraceae bacterium]
MAEHTSHNDVLSIQKAMRVGEKSPYSQRMKQAREIAAEAKGLTKLSQVMFAKMLGVHPSVISHIEAGTTRIQPDMARIVEREIGVRQAWLLTGDGPVKADEPVSIDQEPKRPPLRPSDFSCVKKVKSVLGGGTGQLVDDELSDDVWSFRTDWLLRKGHISDMRLARISGDSMFPTLVDGDLVLFDTSKIEPLDGKIMAVNIDGLLYIKRLRVSPEGFFLVSDNRAVYEPWRISPDTARFLGLVIWRCGEL